MKTAVIIPAFNEAPSIGGVIQAIPNGLAHRVIVVDNASTDETPQIARKHGAEVIDEPQRGYGKACLRGIAAAGDADVLVFLDADFSDDPAVMPRLLEPIEQGEAEFVVGSRILGDAEPGALPPHARFGNQLACFLIRIIYGDRFTDLGPFRAIRRETLERLQMQDEDYGWTVEMQAKAARLQIPWREAPVPYRKRIGRSKISGTVKGSVLAGIKILWTIAKVSLWRPSLSSNR